MSSLSEDSKRRLIGAIAKKTEGNEVIHAIETGGFYHVGPNQAYKTIQSALNAIGDATNRAMNEAPQTVLVDGGIYDEDLTIPKGRLMTLVALGTVVLGNGLGSNFSSTNTRSISATFDTAYLFGGTSIRHALNIGVMSPSDSTSTFLTHAGCWRISGNINTTGAGSHSVILHSVEISGAYAKTGVGACNLHAYRSYFKGTVSGPTITLSRIQDSQFDALITVDGYNSIFNSEIKAGMTVTTIANTLPPNGMFFSTFTGVFTGPANSLRICPTTNYFFKANGATLGGAATKVILSDTVP